MERTVIIVGLLALLLTSPAPASGYVRYLSDSGCPYSWRSRSLPIKAYPKGLPNLDESQIAQAANQSAAAWSRGADGLTSCTDLSLQVTMMSINDTPPAAQFDHQNNLVFRSDTWCPNPTAPCHDSFALAITSVFARTWGEIVDADIEVNAVYFDWGDLVDSPDESGRKQDLQNAVTHEMGHFIGLDHTCYGGDTTRPRPVDNAGNEVPDCNDPNLPESIMATTMFASAVAGDTSKRTLEPDDQLAVCESYPAGRADPLACSGSGSQAGCDVAPAATAGLSFAPTSWQAWGGSAFLVAFALMLWAATKRARSRRA